MSRTFGITRSPQLALSLSSLVHSASALRADVSAGASTSFHTPQAAFDSSSASSSLVLEQRRLRDCFIERRCSTSHTAVRRINTCRSPQSALNRSLQRVESLGSHSIESLRQHALLSAVRFWRTVLLERALHRRLQPLLHRDVRLGCVHSILTGCWPEGRPSS
jgi:hypothetical protein